MKIFGKPLGEYVRFCRVFLVLVAVVGIVRLGLSLGGMPNATTRWFSMNAAGWIGFIYCAVRVQTSGFGSYRHLLPVCALINFTAQAIAIAGIVIAIFSGTDNVFSTPEYAFGSDGKTWLHAGSHLVIGATVGTLVAWVAGSLILFITTKLTRGQNENPITTSN